MRLDVLFRKLLQRGWNQFSRVKVYEDVSLDKDSGASTGMNSRAIFMAQLTWCLWI